MSFLRAVTADTSWSGSVCRLAALLAADGLWLMRCPTANPKDVRRGRRDNEHFRGVSAVSRQDECIGIGRQR